MPSGPRAAAQRPMRCAATRWGSRERYAGSSAECCWSTNALLLVIGLLPEQLERCVAEVGAVRTRLGTDSALVALRALSAAQLPVLPAPLGFHPHRRGSTIRNRPFQHKVGPDPPAAPP